MMFRSRWQGETSSGQQPFIEGFGLTQIGPQGSLVLGVVETAPAAVDLR